MIAKSFGKTKQYRALNTTLIKILFKKNIINPLATNTKSTKETGNCKMCEKHMRKSIISCKDAGHCTIFLRKMSLYVKTSLI